MCISNKIRFDVFYVNMKRIPIVTSFKRPIYRYTGKTGPRTLRGATTLWGPRNLSGPRTLGGRRTLGGFRTVRGPRTLRALRTLWIPRILWRPKTLWGLIIFWWPTKDPETYKLEMCLIWWNLQLKAERTAVNTYYFSSCENRCYNCYIQLTDK